MTVRGPARHLRPAMDHPQIKNRRPSAGSPMVSTTPIERVSDVFLVLVSSGWLGIPTTSHGVFS
jgi:hypothetical protein